MITVLEAAYKSRIEDGNAQNIRFSNTIELIECVSGSGVVLKNDHSYPLQERRLYLIDARRTYNIHSTDLTEYVSNKIVMEADSFFDFCGAAGILEKAEELLFLPPISTELLPDVDRIFKSVSALYKAKEIGFAHGYILQLLHICNENRDSVLSPLQNTSLERTLEIVAESKGATSLEAISTQLHLDKYYLCHLFKNKTGINLSEYIADKRVETSARLLRETNMQIEEIAAACGFSTPQSFTRFFKQKSGIVPREYRKKARL